MKKMKKIAGLLLAMVMVLAMTASVFATDINDNDDTNGNYTISAPGDSKHKYEVYQIFTGDLSGKVLSNVKWGSNGTGTVDSLVSETVLAELTAVNSASDTDKLKAIEKYANLEGRAFGTVTAANSLSVPAGYYLIKDKDGSVSGNDAYTLYIVKIVGDVTIAPKSDVPEFEKKVKDTNDSTANSTTNWQDSADYDIGDAVPFQLKGTVASNYGDYKSYYFAFHDVEEDGLTFNAESVKVYVDGTEIKNGFEVVTEGLTDSDTFEVIFNDLKKIDSVNAGSEITIEYTSTLNEEAVLGSHGNLNKAKLEFSNNPNNEQEGTPDKGETPWDNVIVFTYKVVVNKVDSSKKALEGAEFTLTKILADTSTKTIGVVKNDTGTTFTFKGLDDGKYTLSETRTPEGYNTIADITFTVNADHTITWDGADRDDVLTSLTGNAPTGTITFTENKTEGSLTTDVVNNEGSTLPETGGIGTTIFYVIGTILVLGAAVLLVTKRRMNGQK